MTAMAETIWGDVVCLLLYVCAVLLIIIYIYIISSFVRDQSQGKFVNSFGAITYFGGARALYMRANTREKKRTRNTTTMTTKDKNDDNKRHIKH